MTTPIFDFINEYQKKNPVRLHMPGHKGINTRLGIEQFDITEIEGADELYDADGIIAQSENNASKLFGSHTFYSTEGSSHVIRAMLFLLVRWCRHKGVEPRVLAARNVHKTFINAVALLDIKTDWISRNADDSLEECKVTAKMLEKQLASMENKPAAVYITSPDYLGNVSDVSSIARVCRENNILLLVDNAHGAYLRFLTPSQHPIDFGADMCADSAHKTLPVLTGGAYLHISNSADNYFVQNAKQALEMFGSTSPSYLVMASLDLANEYLENLTHMIKEFEPSILRLKSRLESFGYTLKGEELLKITVDTSQKANGKQLADSLMIENIYPEYIDDNHVVLMLTPKNSQEDLDRFEQVMESAALEIVCDDRIMPEVSTPKEKCFSTKVVMSPHNAIFADYEELPASQCAGRILAATTVSCPPAVPVFMMGERIGTDEYTKTEILDKLLKGKMLKVVKE